MSAAAPWMAAAALMAAMETNERYMMMCVVCSLSSGVINDQSFKLDGGVTTLVLIMAN